jgi:hypothetical protein
MLHGFPSWVERRAQWHLSKARTALVMSQGQSEPGQVQAGLLHRHALLQQVAEGQCQSPPPTGASLRHSSSSLSRSRLEGAFRAARCTTQLHMRERSYRAAEPGEGAQELCNSPGTKSK